MWRTVLLQQAFSLLKALKVPGLVYAAALACAWIGAQVWPEGIVGIRFADQIHILSVAFLVFVAAMAPLHFGRREILSFPKASPHALALLFILLSAAFLAASFPAILEQLNAGFWSLLLGYVGIVLLLQAGCLYLVLRVTRWPLGASLVFVGFSVLNAYATYLVLREDFHKAGGAVQAGVIFLVGLIAGILFAVAASGRWPLRKLCTVLIIVIAAPVAVVIPKKINALIQANQVAAFSGIEFRSMPNVHILGIDSMTAPVLAEKYLKLTDLGYEPLLRSERAILFRNSFASIVPTKRSLNSVMRLAHPDLPGVPDYFAGRRDSPLARVFRDNGYKVLTGFDNLYFGTKGPYVDDYYPRTHQVVAENALCALAVASPLKFYSFCPLMSRWQGPATKQGKWPGIVSARIRSASGSGQPWLTFTHIYNPIGHTSLNYQTSDMAAFEKFRDFYHRQAIRAADIIGPIVESLLNDDGKSVLLVIGDHGPWISRTANEEQEKEFFVQDRHGIAAAVLVNETDCKRADFEHYATSYITPERIIAGLIRCLAKQPEKVDAAVKFKEVYDFKDFLYE